VEKLDLNEWNIERKSRIYREREMRMGRGREWRKLRIGQTIWGRMPPAWRPAGSAIVAAHVSVYSECHSRP